LHQEDEDGAEDHPHVICASGSESNLLLQGRDGLVEKGRNFCLQDCDLFRFRSHHREFGKMNGESVVSQIRFENTKGDRRSQLRNGGVSFPSLPFAFGGLALELFAWCTTRPQSEK
jgi:hypothetical protein